MQKFWNGTVRWLIALIAFAIPIEHKYDKPFRFFSKSLIPEGLNLPFWFDKKIHFYPSDIIVILILGISIFALRLEVRKWFLEKCAPFLFLIAAIAILSIANSSLYNYPIPYFRVWQLLTAFTLFAIIASQSNEERDKTFKLVMLAFVCMGTIQALFGIIQYFNQAPIGLHWLEEPRFVRSRMHPYIPSNDFTRWMIDSWLGIKCDENFLVRATGTLPHPNVLAGYLFMTSMTTVYLASDGKSLHKLLLKLFAFIQFFGLIITYSRAGLFAFFISLTLWFFISIKEKLNRKVIKMNSYVFISFIAIAFLFQNQIISRGGIVNYNKISKNSDKERLTYQNYAFNMISDKPLTGVGYGQFTYQLPKYLPDLSDPEDFRTGTHNIYLLIASEMGLIALASFCAFIGIMLWKGFRNITSPQALLFSIFFSFLFIGGCDFYLILFQQGRLMFFIIAGFLASYIHWNTLSIERRHVEAS